MKDCISLLARSALAVLVGIVAMTAVAFGVEIPLRLVALRMLNLPDPAALDTSAAWMLSQSLYTIPAAVLGGYVAARLAPRRGFAHAVAMAVVQDLLIVVLMFEPPHPVPPWMWAISLIVTPAAILYGGYLHRGPKAEPQPVEPAAVP